MKNEKKSLNLGGKIILNNLSMQMNLPLFEGNKKMFNSLLVHFEYIKPNFKRETSFVRNNINLSKTNFITNYKGTKQNLTLIKKETSTFSISIPILRIPKQIEISSNVLIKNTCARIADIICKACDYLKK